MPQKPSRPDLSILANANLTDEQRRAVAETTAWLNDVERENEGMRANRRLGLVWETESYKARFSDPIWGVDHERGGIVADLIPEHSRPEGDEGNLIIEGDNVDALRMLARTHKGKFDCIFIDPPYNTENTTFVYNDDYVAKEDKLRYSLWCEGLRRRLQYVPDLLSERGVLLVAINDRNRSYVDLVIRDNVMPGKFIGTIAWRSRSGKNEEGNANFSQDHEHVLVYANKGFDFGGREKDNESSKIAGNPFQPTDWDGRDSEK